MKESGKDVLKNNVSWFFDQNRKPVQTSEWAMAPTLVSKLILLSSSEKLFACFETVFLIQYIDFMIFLKKVICFNFSSYKDSN